MIVFLKIPLKIAYQETSTTPKKEAIMTKASQWNSKSES